MKTVSVTIGDFIYLFIYFLGKMSHSNTPIVELTPSGSLALEVWLRMLLEKETSSLASVMQTVFFVSL